MYFGGEEISRFLVDFVAIIGELSRKAEPAFSSHSLKRTAKKKGSENRAEMGFPEKKLPKFLGATRQLAVSFSQVVDQ